MDETDRFDPHARLDFARSSGIITAGQFGGTLIERSSPKSCHKTRAATCAAASLLLLLSTFPLPGQEIPAGPANQTPSEPAKTGKGPVLKEETNLTLVYVTVTEPTGRLVTGLEQSNFRVYEDGKEQE